MHSGTFQSQSLRHIPLLKLSQTGFKIFCPLAGDRWGKFHCLTWHLTNYSHAIMHIGWTLFPDSKMHFTSVTYLSKKIPNNKRRITDCFSELFFKCILLVNKRGKNNRSQGTFCRTRAIAHAGHYQIMMRLSHQCQTHVLQHTQYYH